MRLARILRLRMRILWRIFFCDDGFFFWFFFAIFFFADFATDFWILRRILRILDFVRILRLRLRILRTADCACGCASRMRLASRRLATRGIVNYKMKVIAYVAWITSTKLNWVTYYQSFRRQKVAPSFQLHTKCKQANGQWEQRNTSTGATLQPRIRCSDRVCAPLAQDAEDVLSSANLSGWSEMRVTIKLTSMWANIKRFHRLWIHLKTSKFKSTNVFPNTNFQATC